MLALWSPDLLRLHRQRAGLRQVDLADRVHCSRATIGHLETGEMSRVNDDLAARIVQELGVRLDVLFVLPGCTPNRP